MEELTTIPKNVNLPPVSDYEFLRREGLKHIENLSSDLWTDYNAHDPGITILEALCYAITELGYRSGFDMKDLLCDEEGKLVKDQVLFTAKEILTINPLTVNDYRKLLVDIVGIHNAWLIADDTWEDDKKHKHAVNEVELFADCKNDELTTEPNAHPLFLSGLYRVLLDLDMDDQLGDLNNGDVVIQNPSSTQFKEAEFVLIAELPSWKNADFLFAEKAKQAANIDTLTIAQIGKRFQCTLTLTDSSQLQFVVSIPKQPASGAVTLSDLQEMFNFADAAKKEGVASLFETYLAKISKAKSIVYDAIQSLHAHRNLCEDFMNVTTIEDEEIAFCFDVDVQPSADIEKVQAEMFYAIENYLNPSLQFYTLKELLDKKIPVDDIFNGPVLQHGFIDTKQLEETNLRTVIHASDIINLLMDIEGVIAIRHFLMTKYDAEGKPVPLATSQQWCLSVSQWHKPVLSTDKSKILLFKNGLPFIARYEEVRDSILLLHAIRSGNKLTGLAQDLPFPLGNKRDTESYWPVQYDFPQTYGIGINGLPSGATEGRIAQQRQLKAYLMFYEQLLAGFFSQLSGAHHLFSIADITQTYYTQFLQNIKDIGAVYNTAAPFGSLQSVIATPDATAELQNGWQALFEPKDVFEDRRSRFLDHLLARFAESFNDYALLMYKINYDNKSEEKISFADLSAAKRNTLSNYPHISSERGKAFNYFPLRKDETTGAFSLDAAQYWDTDNVSGLEKRISALAGIAEVKRRFLYCIRNESVVCNEKTVVENGEEILTCFHSFSFTAFDGTQLHSLEYRSKEEAEAALTDAIELAGDIINYLFDAASHTLQVIGNANEVLLETGNTFADKPAAMATAETLANEFATACNNPVGLHLLEHILLRPRKPDFDLMQVCLADCDCPCEFDPYSFKATVVLPSNAGHFDNMDFRQYFENKLREEAPAHVMLKICWLNNDLMRAFEKKYKAWIEALATYSFDPSGSHLTDFRTANNDMIQQLTLLHSEYPEASLHDCVESKEGSHTVVLGKTVLGTFKS